MDRSVQPGCEPKQIERQLPQLKNDGGLFTQQDEYSSEYGEYCYDHPQTIKIHSRDKCSNARNYEPDAQQQHPYIIFEVHRNIPFFCMVVNTMEI